MTALKKFVGGLVWFCVLHITLLLPLYFLIKCLGMNVRLALLLVGVAFAIVVVKWGEVTK